MSSISGPKVVQGSSSFDADLDGLNRSISEKGVKLIVVKRGTSLFIRGTFVQLDGSSKRQRIPLDLPATSGSLLEAENRIIQFAAEYRQKGVIPDPFPWKEKFIPVQTTNEISVDGAIIQLHIDFWKGKEVTSSSRRTWERLENELKRLRDYANADLTIDLLVAVAEAKTAAGTRSRLESCKVFKRLGKLAGLTELEKLDEIRPKKYKPQKRDIPDEEHLIELAETLRNDKRWGWCTAAMLVYGCRPSEVFSLQPNKDGTAKVLTLNKKDQIEWRTALALPYELVESLDLYDIQRDWEFTKRSYDSAEAKRQTDMWGGWLSRNCGHMALQLYDIRHAWCIRSIRANIQTGLAAKCMGHDITTHMRTYASALAQADVAAVAASLRK